MGFYGIYDILEGVMQPLVKRVQKLDDDIAAAYDTLAIEQKLAEAGRIEEELGRPDAWLDAEAAGRSSKQLAVLRAVTEPWQELRRLVSELGDMIALDDASLAGELEADLEILEQRYQKLRRDLFYSGPYDSGGAIIKISAGAGGTDAQDWAEMLERMYLRYLERSLMSVELIERSAGEEAGIKSATYSVSGPYAYGKLRSEHGVHRLVRLSPFNSDHLRQTSFALVEVLPDIESDTDVAIDDKDLKIDVYRSGGHGGQSVNTTDSAVRVTHLPTSITVAIQNERSQIQNRETALKILRAKLVQLQQEQHAETIADLRTGESASWGNQIRNYVLHPYTMVKDTRTKHEVRDASRVLDGDIDEFIEAYLESIDNL